MLCGNEVPIPLEGVRFVWLVIFSWSGDGFIEKPKLVTCRLGGAMAQAVSRRPPTAEVRVRSRVSPCGICGGQSGTGTGFSLEFFGFPLSVSFHRCSITRKRTKK
jgi:hypothetical protein